MSRREIYAKPPLFKSDHFIYWKNRFETYMNTKDLDLWHIILNGDFSPVDRKKETQILEVLALEEQSDDLKKKLPKNNKAKMFLYNALPKKEYERIFMCKTAKDIWKSLLITHQEESIDSGFARFNTIITSLKALDEAFSSKNYVRKFLRALHLKWRAKVMTTEESKDLSSLALDELIGNLKVTAVEELKDLSSLAQEELIGNLKVHELVMEKDSKIYKGKKERIKSITLKDKKETSDDETSTFRSDDEEYATALRNFKKFFRRKGLGFDSSKASTSGTKTMSFVGSSTEKAMDGSTIKVHGSTLRGSVSRTYGEKGIEHVFSPPMSSRSDFVITRKKLMCNSIDEVFLRTCLELDEWIKDSGCSKHMTGNKSLFSTYKAYDEDNVVFGSNLKGKIIGKVLNKLTMKVEESLNVTFDEIPPPTKLSPLVDDDVGEEESIKKNTKVVNNYNEEDKSIEADEIINVKESKNHPLDKVIRNLNQITLKSQDQNHKFEMSMMGELNFFLGLQIKQIEDRIFFNQSKYIKEMLKKFGLEDSKPTKMPMSTEIKLTKDDEANSVDRSKYQGQDRQMEIVGGNGGNQFRQYAGHNARNLTRYNDVQNIGNQ
nr:hypothetical protein [Tanacetum cinerariifolium]